MAHRALSPTSRTLAFLLFGSTELLLGLASVGCTVDSGSAAPDQQGLTLAEQPPSAAPSNGSAEIHVPLNTSPVVTNTSATPDYLTKGGQTLLQVTATDADGDAIRYQWTSSCPGAFTDPQSATPGFTLASGATATSCTLSVAVSDNRGGSATGGLTMAVGQTGPVLAPTITSSLQSSGFADASSPVVIAVEATDPQGLGMTFSWSADGGDLGTPTNTANSSQIVWTSPATPAPSWHVTIVVSNGHATTTKTFTVKPATLG